jgi:integrase
LFRSGILAPMARRPRKRTYKTGAIAQVGRRWRIRWRQGARRLSLTFETRELAELALAAKVGAVARGEADLRPDPKAAQKLAELFAPWIKTRKATHRDARNDENRWDNHLAEHVGRLRPEEVDQGVLKDLIDDCLRKGLSTATTRLVLRLLSTFFSDLVDAGDARLNPVKQLAKKHRKRTKPTHDPKTTPFIEQLDDVARLFLRLPKPISIAFAVGALAGPRTGEVLALERRDVNLEERTIHIQRAMKDGKVTLLKDVESRVVPLQDSLAPILRAWFLENPGPLVVPPLRRRRGARYMRKSTLWKALRKAIAGDKEQGLAPLALPPDLTWYQATRHTFASQWVKSGGTLERLQQVMGHSSIVVTERYAHLRPSTEDRDRLQVDLSTPAGAVVSLRAPKRPVSGPSLGPAAKSNPG